MKLISSQNSIKTAHFNFLERVKAMVRYSGMDIDGFRQISGGGVPAIDVRVCGGWKRIANGLKGCELTIVAMNSICVPEIKDDNTAVVSDRSHWLRATGQMNMPSVGGSVTSPGGAWRYENG